MLGILFVTPATLSPLALSMLMPFDKPCMGPAKRERALHSPNFAYGCTISLPVCIPMSLAWFI